MLLETLDIKKDDIVIYSQNLFNNDKNFRIIFKDNLNKESHKISYSEVCSYINEFTPKNIIVYRLLTNIRDFEIYVPKYGMYININGVKEMIFFDPVYAVQELEEYSNNIDYNNLRFRIQQVGLTTLNRKGDLPNFAEIYSIDLEATEAKFQNDKVFADAIISTYEKAAPAGKISDSKGMPQGTGKKDVQHDKTIADSKINIKEEPRIKKVSQDNYIKKEPAVVPPKENLHDKVQQQTTKTSESLKYEDNTYNWIDIPDDVVTPTKNKPANNITREKPGPGGIRIVQHNISEDKNFNYKEIMKINFKGVSGLEGKKIESAPSKNSQISPSEKKPVKIEPKIEKTEDKNQSPFGKFLKESKTNKNDKKTIRQPGDEKVSQVLDMFKSASNEYVNNRAEKQIVLKLDSSEQNPVK
jgi:hypothetical protein